MSTRIRQFREQRGIQIDDLAARAGVALETLRDIESGAITKPMPMTLRRIARALNVPPDELLESASQGATQAR